MPPIPRNQLVQGTKYIASSVDGRGYSDIHITLPFVRINPVGNAVFGPDKTGSYFGYDSRIVTFYKIGDPDAPTPPAAPEPKALSGFGRSRKQRIRKTKKNKRKNLNRK